MAKRDFRTKVNEYSMNGVLSQYHQGRVIWYSLDYIQCLDKSKYIIKPYKVGDML